MSESVTRVAIVIPHYPPRIGGSERYAERLAQHLQASARHEVIVVCANDTAERSVEMRDSIPVVRLPTRAVLSNTPVNFTWLWEIPRLLRQLDVDIVNAHSPVPFMADIAVLTKRSRPTILTYHSGALAKGRRLVDAVLRLYERLVLPVVFKRCDGLVAVSSISTTYRYPRAQLIEPGVDVEVFSPPQLDVRREPLIVYVGRIERSSRWKGVDVLIDAMPMICAEIPEARLEMVGSGDWIPELQDRASNLGIESRIDWRGTMEGEHLTDAYRRAGVVVLPSLTSAESFGMVLIEAMACGAAVVASRVGGIPDVVRDGEDGVLVGPGDPVALAKACVSILSDSHRAEQMGAAGRRAAEERWEWSKQMAKMVEYIDEVTAVAGSRRPQRVRFGGPSDPIS